VFYAECSHWRQTRLKQAADNLYNILVFEPIIVEVWNFPVGLFITLSGKQAGWYVDEGYTLEQNDKCNTADTFIYVWLAKV